jgi:hypothetical protein
MVTMLSHAQVLEWHLNSLSDFRTGVMIQEADVLEPLEMQTQ